MFALCLVVFLFSASTLLGLLVGDYLFYKEREENDEHM